MLRGLPNVRQNHVVLPKSFPKGKIKHASWYTEDITGPMKTVFPTGTVMSRQPPNPSSPHLSSLFVLNSQPCSCSHSGLHLLLLPQPIIIPVSVTNFFPVPLSFSLSLPVLLSSYPFIPLSKSHTVPFQFLHIQYFPLPPNT